MSDLSKSVLPVTQSLLLEREESVLKIWFNRPEAKNALSAEMTEELNAVLEAVQADRSIRTIVLRGKGGVFCAGGDIKGFKSGMQATDADEVAASNRRFGNLMIDLAEYSIILPGINTYTGQIIQTLFKREGIPLKAPMSTNYLETISTMVEVGLGWSVLPETLVRGLHVMPFEDVKIERELGYIHHTKRSLSNAAVAFLALLTTAAQI